jgi:hypothetical protein
MLYRELLVRFAMVLLVLAAGELLVFTIERAHAATIGYRIRLEVCGEKVCRQIRTPANLWGGKYACDGRAEIIQDEAAAFLRAQAFKGPRPYLKVGARCVAVSGLKEA